MNNFERVLSGDDVFDLHEKYDGCVFKVIESVEQVVLAKLAGQEQPDVTQLLKALERIVNMDSMSYHSLDSAKITARNALAAHPMPCVSESAESNTQHHLEYIKRYQKWRRGEDKTMSEMGLTPKQIGEALDWLIGVADDHVADKRKMVVPDGWQLTPSEPTMDMIKALLETIVTTSKGGVVNPKTTLTYALAAAPKYTGEK